MGFIIRSVFWLSLVLLLVPIGGNDEGAADTVGPVEAFVAARGAIGDISGMCERQPEVCEIGKSAIYTIGVRAREGARMAMAAIEDDGARPDAELTTGSVPASE
ncbi:MAG: DUF5330 domain-containing protein [Rhizobiaceae bacterium]|nr:DUF5330 domain-containing protein [Rhizobiaceae bacterium]